MKRLTITLLTATLCFFSAVSYSEDAMAPIHVETKAVDLPNTSAKSIQLSLDAAQFEENAVGHIDLKANQLDLRAGALNQLNLTVKNGEFGERLQLKELAVETGAFQFDTFSLLNQQKFILTNPVSGKVNLALTDQNLTDFVAHPKTLSKLNKALAKQTGGIQLLTFTKPKFTILPQQRLDLTLTAVVGNSLLVPLNLNGDIHLKKGDVVIQNLKVLSGDAQLPIEVSGLLEKELNKMISLKRLSEKYFQLSADTVQSISHQLSISGQAKITALKF